MALEAGFLSLTNQAVAIAPLSTASPYGAPSFGAAVSFPAYVEPGARVVVSTLGVEEVTTAMVYVLSSSASVGAQDKLTLPDGRVPKILRVDVLNDDEGQHHVEVAVQ